MLFVNDAKRPRERRALINECNRFDSTDLNRSHMTAVLFKSFIILLYSIKPTYA